jgi:3D (Asp-Asp-Asp) domain-containing protein
VKWAGRWRTYNYAGPGPSAQVDCSARYPRHPATGRSRFKASNKPYGEGASGARLVPFRSIAVDPRFIRHGTVLYIPAARGVSFSDSDGEKRSHDGYFFAADTGGAIKGPHIDFFLGARGANPFGFIGSSKKQTFEAFVIDEDELEKLLGDAHELHSQD